VMYVSDNPFSVAPGLCHSLTEMWFSVRVLLSHLLLLWLTVNAHEGVWSPNNIRDLASAQYQRHLARSHAAATGPEDPLPPTNKETALEWCLECEVLFELLKGEINLGVDNATLLGEAQTACEAIGVSWITPLFCEGWLSLGGPILFHVLSLPHVTAADACGELLTYVGCTSNNPDRDWTIEISGDKPTPIPLTPPPDDEKRMKILHIADTHVDPLYQPGANAVCPEPLCCRNESGPLANESDGAWFWGDLRGCGTPPWVLEDLLQQAREQHPDIYYVVWTGDVVPHAMWETSQELNLQMVRETNQMIQKVFPDRPVFPVVGNHEANPLDQFPAPGQAPASLDTAWLYEGLTQEWSNYLSTFDNSTLLRGGYYSTLIWPGYRIIAINTMWGYTSNIWLTESSIDPGDQLAWLEACLNKAEADEELVHILGHVPPGSLPMDVSWSREYTRIINRYENIVKAQFFGHTHNDEFEVFYDGDRPTNVAYVAPSATPWEHLHPGYRIYYLDGEHINTTWAVVDHETWIMNLTEAQETGKPRYYQLYSAKDEYSMDGLLPANWDDFAQRMSQDRSLFDLYYKNFHKASEMMLEMGCDDVCYQQRLCDVVTSDRNNLGPCYNMLQQSMDILL
ncbi:unnamed protein product, partial [Meganyctiphanes norvegica]